MIKKLRGLVQTWRDQAEDAGSGQWSLANLLNNMAGELERLIPSDAVGFDAWIETEPPDRIGGALKQWLPLPIDTADKVKSQRVHVIVLPAEEGT